MRNFQGSLTEAFDMTAPIQVHRRPLCLVLIALIAVLSGCSKPLFTPHRVETQAEAGSTHVAVTLVAPWDEFIDDLQPRFEMSGARALDMVVPDTISLDEKILDQLGVRLKFAPPQTSVVETITAKEETGAAPTRSSESTAKKEPGDISSLKAGEPLAGTRKIADLPTISKALGIDPMLRHWAALALFQEVQLLNRYVQRAALRYGYRPYVVRLQVSVMPAARNEPYDAYSIFSFFNVQREADGGQALPTDLQKPIAAQTQEEKAAFRTPYVIPLLVTDNLEAAVHSRTVDTVRQLGLALSVLVQGFAASAEAERLLEELKSVLGRDLNSLLTVARLSDNSIRVRLGALGQAEARYSMVPRTHNVTLLLLVAKEHADPPTDPPPASYRPTVQLVAKTTMVDAERGTPLPFRSREEQQVLFANALVNRVNVTSSSGQSPGPNEWSRRGTNLLRFAQQNRYADFLELIEDYRQADAKQGVKWEVPSQPLWIDLLSLMIGSQFHAASFDLPYRQQAHLPVQHALMVDDGESQSVVTLSGGRGLAGPRLTAQLTLVNAGTSYTFQPERVTVADGGRQIALVFPSLTTFGFSPKPDGSELSLQVDAGGDSWAGDETKSWRIPRVLYRKAKEKVEPGFSLTIPAGAVLG